MRVVFLLAVVATLVACACATEFQWGEPGPKDYLIAKDKVSKRGIFGLKVTKKYVLKQKDLDALTINYIKVTDRSKKKLCKATVELINGGPGSKGVTLKFTSERGKRFRCLVWAYGKK